MIASVKGIPGGGGDGKTQFACGVVPEMLGQNVPISGKEKVHVHTRVCLLVVLASSASSSHHLTMTH